MKNIEFLLKKAKFHKEGDDKEWNEEEEEEMKEALDRISLDEDELKFNFGVPVVLTSDPSLNIVEETSTNDYYKQKIEFIKFKLTKFARSVGAHVRVEELETHSRILDGVFPNSEKPMFQSLRELSVSDVTTKVEEQVLEKPSKPRNMPLMSSETKIKSLEGLLKEMESSAPAPKKFDFP